MSTAYSFYTTVEKIEEHRKIVRGYKDETGAAVVDEKSLGWFIHLEGSRESLGVGAERPDLEVGQKVKVLVLPVAETS